MGIMGKVVVHMGFLPHCGASRPLLLLAPTDIIEPIGNLGLSKKSTRGTSALGLEFPICIRFINNSPGG